MDKRVYRLKLCGKVEFTDKDKELEDKLLSFRDSASFGMDPTDIDIVLQELTETSRDISVEIERI